MLKQRQVCMISIFPPPLHGMSLINDFVRRRISLKTQPLVIDLSTGNLDRSIMARVKKVFRAIPCVLRFVYYLLFGRVGSVYIGLSGGMGKAYDAIFSVCSRLFGRNLYLHHHSYQYLNQFSWLAQVLFVIAGNKAIHIVACEKMASDLKRLYPIVTNVRVISGIVALDSWNDVVRQHITVQSIGFLSNISIEKGILDFLNVAAWADEAQLPIRFIVAGPYQDDNVRSLVNDRLEIMKNVTYVGPVYHRDKLAFFDSIDAFLFPTKYINESEGLVIHEAMSRGVPVIAYSRGCIEQIVSNRVGLCLAPSDEYVAGVIKKLKEWLENPHEFQSVSTAAFNQFNNTRFVESEKMEALCAELVEQGC